MRDSDYALMVCFSLSLSITQLLQQATTSSNLGAFSGIQQMAGEILLSDVLLPLPPL